MQFLLNYHLPLYNSGVDCTPVEGDNYSREALDSLKYWDLDLVQFHIWGILRERSGIYRVVGLVRLVLTSRQDKPGLCFIAKTYVQFLLRCSSRDEADKAKVQATSHK